MRGVGKARFFLPRLPPSPRRSPKRAERTRCGRPVAAATSRSMPPGFRLSSIAGVGGRAGAPDSHAVLGALAILAQVNQQNVGPPPSFRSLRARSRPAPALARIVLVAGRTCMFGRQYDVHQLRIRQIEVVHQLDIFVDRAQLEGADCSASPRRWWRRYRPL